MLTPDTVLQGRYRVVRHLGQGGMGTVYEAVDQRLETVVAVKESHLNDPVLVKQFALEARLLAKLRHPALTKVIDHFEESGAQFLVMEYIPGPDLSALLDEQKGPFPVTQILKWADQLLNALNYLHTQTPSIIHRDIKPQNLKLTSEDQIILLDFGLAKGTAGGVSKVASVYGYTPTYAPLEQIQGTGTEPRSDLYSLAATLYQLMTNVSPPDALTRVMDITNELPDPLIPASKINPQIAEGIAQTLGYAMHLNRDKRPATAAVMRELLRVGGVPATAPSRDSDKTLVLPSSPSTAETLQVPSGALPLTEASPAVGPTVAAEQTQQFEPNRNTVRDPALAGFMSGGYETEGRSRLPWIALPILGVLLLAGVSYGGYWLYSSKWGGSEPQAGAVPVASPTSSPAASSGPPTVNDPITIGGSPQSPTASPSAPNATPAPTMNPQSSPAATPTPQSQPTPRQDEPPPPATPAPPKIIQGGVVNGKAISLPKPAYPASARAVRAQGAVNVQVIIDESGNVTSATAISGHALLRASAVSAARGARFSPTKLSGVPVKVSGIIIYNFVAE